MHRIHLLFAPALASLTNDQTLQFCTDVMLRSMRMPSMFFDDKISERLGSVAADSLLVDVCERP